MPEVPERVKFLQTTHLFRNLKEPEIATLAGQMNDVFYEDEGAVIFDQGAPANAMYFIYKGSVSITRQVTDTSGRKREQVLGRLVVGDYFGEEGLLAGGKRTARATAARGTVLFNLPGPHLKGFLKTNPELKTAFKVMIDSRRLARRLKFKWLQDKEVVYYLGRKHPFLLYTALILPLLGVMLAGFVLGLGAALGSDVPLAIGGVLLAGFFLWGVWRWLDWGNDYYIVTNQRVVRIEKVIALYDSREEAMLSTVLSIGTDSNQFGRWFDFGNVVVRTFTGNITMANIEFPRHAAMMVEEYWQRTQRSNREVEGEAMQKALRDRIDRPKVAPAPSQPPPTVVKKESYTPNLLHILFANFFRVRFEDSNVITYRKHWFKFVLNMLWRQVLPLLFVVGIFFAFPPLVGTPVPTWLGTMLSVLVLGIVLWWIYDYEDWANDVYQVTPDQIIDVYRRPLGTEERKAAPLENILSTSFQRNGIFGLVFNFGTVKIMVGGTQFDFEDVFDPPQVQQDIIRRMSVRRLQKQEADRKAERERMADWLATYHRLSEEIRRDDRQPGPGNSG